jgi:hypothetical protein
MVRIDEGSKIRKFETFLGHPSKPENNQKPQKKHSDPHVEAL